MLPSSNVPLRICTLSFHALVRSSEPASSDVMETWGTWGRRGGVNNLGRDQYGVGGRHDEEDDSQDDDSGRELL